MDFLAQSNAEQATHLEVRQDCRTTLANDPGESIEATERRMLAMPQAECPLGHHFGPGVYVRELSMKAGTWAIGHRQKFPHMNILLQGAVRMVNEDGSTTDLHAPLIFTGQPGRKVGYVLEDMVWLNVYASEERDIDALESHFIEKSDAWRQADGERMARLSDEREADRRSFAELSSANPIPCAAELGELPVGMEVRPSAIHGMGVFLSAGAAAFQTIGEAVVMGQRTAAGRYLNHSATPNAILVRRRTGEVDIVTTAAIRGPLGGHSGDEVTINYEQAEGLFIQRKELLP